MKDKFKKLYMDWANRVSRLSHAKRLNVGAVIVKDDTVISYGYNGMPAGWDNDCEFKNYMSIDAGGWINPDELEMIYPHEEFVPSLGESVRYRLVTKPEVLHAESNAIAKLARSVNSGKDSDLFVTHSPCIECAKLIYQAGIKRVWYGQNYRDNTGIEFLKKSGVEVEQLKDE
jgi:dCMP deaminase